MRLDLTPHPDHPCEAVTGLVVEVTRLVPARLGLRYTLKGTLGSLTLAPPSQSTPAGGLWRHTCFEAFARAGDAAGYLEMNFAPSTQWAAYRFAGYREGMAPAGDIEPRIAVRRAAAEFVLDVDVALDIAAGTAVRLGLSAVVEDAKGRLSYWALAHPPGRPDFHHADCFAVELPGVSDP